MRRVEVTAYAKINLSLEVLGKRPDGFHEVRTLMQSISLSDRLELREAAQTSLKCDVDGLAEEDNLVLRAAGALMEARGGLRAAEIVLEKGIPIAGGLGGASADAAAALVGLSALWQLELPRSVMQDLAVGLGSDVPFFLSSGTALARGRGEIVEPLPDIAPHWLVVLVPSHALVAKTAELYRRLTPDCWSDGGRTAQLVQIVQDNLPVPEELLTNSFEQVADQLFPSLAQYRRAMLDAGASAVHLSGAGPAQFALFPNEPAARAAASRLTAAGYHPFVARTMSAAEARPHPIEL